MYGAPREGAGMGVMAEVWQRMLSVQAAPDIKIVVGVALLAIVMVIPSVTWSATRHLVTIAHEGAHGVAALLAGRRLSGIRLHSDTSGLTVSRGKPRGSGMVLTFFAGYTGPAVFGVAAATVLAAGHAVALLWGLIVLLALLLLQIRNWFGLWSVAVTAFVVFAVSWWFDEQVQSAFAYLVTFFLLFAAPRPVIELQRLRWRGAARRSDADELARLTRLPGLFWVAVFGLITFGAATVGCYILLVPYRQ
jgi:peptidase M50B-like protein